jgi:uncharacterized oligopeptide transporter (OPT) family protein
VASADELERTWREEVYRGAGVRQLTARALLTGALIGAVTGITNLYVGLKVGWSVGVVLTASIVGWAAWRTGLRWGLLRDRPSVLEANAMASTASAAGYSTGTIVAGALGGYLIATGHHLPLWQLTAWVLAVSMLGLFVAIPLKRALINVEQLPFPTGAAAAETLRTLCEREAAGGRQAKALVVALGVGVALKWFTGVMPLLAPTLALPEQVAFVGAAGAYTWAFQLSTLLAAAGALVGLRIAVSVLVGAIVCWAVVAPRLVANGVIAEPGYLAVVDWSVWPGTTLMIVGALVHLAFRWRSIAGAFANVSGLAGRRRHDPLVDIEPPRRWFLGGVSLSGLACVVLLRSLFAVPIVYGILAVLLAGVLAIVAARVTGETDVTPGGPLGKVAQLLSAPVIRGAGPNLMVASVSAGAAASAADLLTDLKSGYLLGANPRQQFLAQAAGVVVGVLCVVPVFRWLVPTADMLGTEAWPASAAQAWAAVAKALSTGLDALHPTALWAVAIAALVAVTLAVAEHLRPAWRPWLPSATGLGIAFVLPASCGISFCLGALVATVLVRRHPDRAPLVVPIASGLLAGESLTGTVTAIVTGWLS